MEAAYSSERTLEAWIPEKSYLETVEERFDIAKKNRAIYLSASGKGAVLTIIGISTLILFPQNHYLHPCAISMSLAGGIVICKGLVNAAAEKVREIQLISCYAK